MNLERLTVDIRPRAPWEAIDLGFQVARRWYRRLWLLWLMTALPVLFGAAVIGLLLPGSGSKWTLLLFWFFKPLAEPCLLLWVSKALFGEQCTTAQVIREMKTTGRQLIVSLLPLRFSPFRSFSLPVIQLEKLKGTKKRQRLGLLKDTSETAVLLTISGFFLEIVLTFSQLMIIFFLIPDQLRWISFGRFVFLPDRWFLLVCYFASCSFIAPLYVCSGFMMYISRRVQLEAWDIEIGFKRIRQRLKKKRNGLLAAAMLLLIPLALAGSPASAGTVQPNPQRAKKMIGKVLQDKDFGHKITVYRWVPKPENTPRTSSPWTEFWSQLFESLTKISGFLVPFMARYGELLLWCGVGILIAIFLLKYAKLRNWLDRLPGRDEDDTAPETLFGLDLAPTSLPDRIDLACRQLLDDGKKLEAISLLYRATLSLLVHRLHLPLRASFTEGECCLRVRQDRPESEAAFFFELCSLWMRLAFGHRDPEIEACRDLLTRWESLYGAL